MSHHALLPDVRQIPTRDHYFTFVSQQHAEISQK